jgi:dienelactone hydrolase
MLSRVGAYALDPRGQVIAAVEDRGLPTERLVIRELASGAVMGEVRERIAPEGLAWTEDGRLAALSVRNGHAFLHILSISDGRLSQRRPVPLLIPNAFADAEDPANLRGFSWLPDGSGLRLELRATRFSADIGPRQAGPFIFWNYRDLLGPPRIEREQDALAAGGYRLPAIAHLDGHVVAPVDRATPYTSYIMPPRSTEWLLRFDITPYVPELLHDGEVSLIYGDLYGFSFRTGAWRLLFRRLMAENGRFPGYIASPDGSHVLVWRDNRFLVKNVADGTEVAISRALEASVVDTSEPRPLPTPYPPGGYRGDMEPVALGWTASGNALLLHDGRDIWLVPLPTGAPANMTGGASEDAIWARSYTGGRDSIGIGESESPGIDDGAPLVVSPYWPKDHTRGLAVFRSLSARPAVLRRAASRFDGFAPVMSRDGSTLVYSQESSADRPSVRILDMMTGMDELLFQSPLPLRLRDVALATDVISVDYSCSGRSVSGYLLLPPNSFGRRNLPVVVDIYERQGFRANRYPSLGFYDTASLFASNGFAVFKPDLVYRPGTPFVSANECLDHALDALVSTGLVSHERMAVTGVSFGAAETNFIVTQSRRFRAAISISGYASLLNFYHGTATGSQEGNIGDNGTPGRIQGPLEANDLEARSSNSAVLHAGDVNAPVLLIHGDSDEAVDFSRSLEFFDALRGHGKPAVLIQIRGGGHDLSSNPAAVDLADMQLQFLNHFLRGRPVPAWWSASSPMEPGSR